VARYIRTGEFGLWRETGELNDWVREAADSGLGLGENAGRRIAESDYPHRDLSVLAAAWNQLSVPVTVHVGIGYDILHEHPNCDGAAFGAASYRDFLIFARAIERLEGGVLAELRLGDHGARSLSEGAGYGAQRGASRGPREIRNFATAVFDLAPIRATFTTSFPRPILAIISGRTKRSWSARWRTAARASISAAIIAPRSRAAPGHSRTRMTTAEILAAIPEAFRARGGRYLPRPLVYLRSRPLRNHRAKPASRASA
jgi:hypothetical protein